MKKIRLPLIVILCMFISLSYYSQGYYHGAGGQIIGGNQKISYSTDGSDNSVDVGYGAPSLFYKATYLINEASMSFGVSAYPAIAMAGSSQDGSLALGAELPVLAELYFGDIEDACFFAGVGLSAGILAQGDQYPGTLKVIGPQVAIGGQLSIKGNLIGVKGSFTPAINKPSYSGSSSITISEDKRMMFTLGFYYVLGQ